MMKVSLYFGRHYKSTSFFSSARRARNWGGLVSFLKPSQVRALSTMSSYGGLPAANALANIRVAPVVDGAIAGEAINAQNLWSEGPTMVYVVRRPGGAKLVGIIKEVAPVGKVKTDAELGVGEFQRKYFANHPVYIDAERQFYSFLGGKSLLAQPLHSWNPFTLYNDFKKLGERTKSKGLEGNLAGEGLIKGGLLIITPKSGIVYRHDESTGSCMPYDEIKEALDRIIVEEGGSVEAAPTCSLARPAPGAASDGADCGCEVPK